MRYLGLDLGTKTLGVALSDLTGTIASSYKIIRYEGNLEELIKEISQIITEYSVKTIVLWYPKNMNNTVGESANRALEFKEMLEQSLKIPVFLQDERLSTVEATNYLLEADLSRKKRKQKIDSVAASIILQTYLDRKRKKNEWW